MEYREGMTVCSDCKVELVEELIEVEEPISLYHTKKKSIADRLLKYLNYSGLSSASVSLDETNQEYHIVVSPKEEKSARKHMQAFFAVELTNLKPNVKSKSSAPSEEDNDYYEEDDSEEFVDEEASEENQLEEDLLDEFSKDAEDEYKPAPPPYVFKEDLYKDLNSSVGLFLFFGIVGLIVVFLNVVGILSIFNGLLPNLVMGALFVIFLYIALSSHQKAKQVKSEIAAENKLTKEINSWLEFNVTDRFLDTHKNPDISDEANYLHIVDTIKDLLIKEFGEQNLSYLDRLIEEFYSNTFDQE
jgi:uncharacterized membrane protein